jgi:hypothetical protein
MIPAIIATILLALWIAGQWYFNEKKVPTSIANDPFMLPIGGRIMWLACAWLVTFLLVPTAMTRVADPLRFLVLLSGGCMVIAGALPIHEDEQGVGGDLYKLFSIGVILFSQALAAITHPLSMLLWLPFCAYAASCIIRAKEWPSWRLWAGITAYFTIIFSIFCS